MIVYDMILWSFAYRRYIAHYFILISLPQFEPIKGNDGKENSQATQLFSGWKNECCTKRNAYHLVFPDTATAEDKATLIGASILIDVLYAEQQNDDNDN